jgi:hypothetical protein
MDSILPLLKAPRSGLSISVALRYPTPPHHQQLPEVNPEPLRLAWPSSRGVPKMSSPRPRSPPQRTTQPFFTYKEFSLLGLTYLLNYSYHFISAIIGILEII